MLTAHCKQHKTKTAFQQHADTSGFMLFATHSFFDTQIEHELNQADDCLQFFYNFI